MKHNKLKKGIVVAILLFFIGAGIIPWASALSKDVQPPEPPFAKFDYSPEKPNANEMINFDASESYHPQDHHNDFEEKIIEYLWDFDNDGIYDDASGMYVKHSWSTEGVHYASLKVVGNIGMNDTKTKVIKVYIPTSLSIENIQCDEGKITAQLCNNGEGTCDPYWWIKVNSILFNFISVETYNNCCLNSDCSQKISTDESINGFGIVMIEIGANAFNANQVLDKSLGLAIGSNIFMI